MRAQSRAAKREHVCTTGRNDFIVAHNRLRRGVMAHSKTRHALGDMTEQNSSRVGGNLDCLVDSARFLAVTR